MLVQKVSSRYFKRCVLTLAVLGIATACSLLGTLYQNATSLAMLEIDNYFDLNDEQADSGKLRTDALLAWHKREVLPLYVKQLRALASKAEPGFSAAEANDVLDWGVAELRRVAAYAAPQQAELLTSLSDKQIAYFQKKLAKDNVKYRKEWVDAKRDEALELRFDKLMTWLERVYGSFSSEQKKRIRALSDARTFEPQTAYAERLARQTQFLNVIKTVSKDKTNQTAAQTAIAAFISTLEKTTEHTSTTRKELTTLLAVISQIATPEQRVKAKTTLLDYASTFEGISRGR